LQSLAFLAVSCTCPVQSLPSRLSMWLNSRINLTMTYEASTRALVRPRQLRGPPPKGRYCQASGLKVFHRSGLKSSASSPQTDFSRCRLYQLVSNPVPAGAKIGLFPSGPPPVGRIVSTRATRFICGNIGYRRRAMIGYSSVNVSISGQGDGLTFIQYVAEISHALERFLIYICVSKCKNLLA